MQLHSAIFSTFIKQPFFIKTFVLCIFQCPFYTGFTVRVLQYRLICGQRLPMCCKYNCAKVFDQSVLMLCMYMQTCAFYTCYLGQSLDKGLCSLDSSLIIFLSFYFSVSWSKTTSIVFQINNGQLILLMWYLFILLIFRIIA